MRKIETAESVEKRRRRNTMILSVIMLLILVFSTVGYSVLSRPESGTEDQTQNLYPNEYIVNGQRVIFSYSREEVSDVDVQLSRNLNDLVSENIYVASENQNAYLQIYSVLGLFGKVQKACYGPCEENIPEKECSDNLIVWRDSEENKVTQEENCVFIDGDLRAVDAFLYKILDL